MNEEKCCSTSNDPNWKTFLIGKANKLSGKLNKHVVNQNSISRLSVDFDRQEYLAKFVCFRTKRCFATICWQNKEPTASTCLRCKSASNPGQHSNLPPKLLLQNSEDRLENRLPRASAGKLIKPTKPPNEQGFNPFFSFLFFD